MIRQRSPGGRGRLLWNRDAIVPEQLLQLGDPGRGTAVAAILQRSLALNVAAAAVGRVGLVALPGAVKLLASLRVLRSGLCDLGGTDVKWIAETDWTYPAVVPATARTTAARRDFDAMAFCSEGMNANIFYLQFYSTESELSLRGDEVTDGPVEG